MKLATVAGMTAATLMTVAPPAFAQAQTKTADTTTTQTFTGCLMTESAYRKAHNLGSGALGGVGLGDELVLVDVKVSPASGAAETTASNQPTDTKTASRKAVNDAAKSAPACADKGVAYRLTGSKEDQMSKMPGLLGHQVAVQGRFKDADDVAKAAAPVSGKLPAEVTIESYSAVANAAPVNEPPAAVATPPSTTPAPVTTPNPPATTMPTPNQPKELPHTASSNELFGLIGALTLFSGALVSAFRRRAA